ncbi:nuclear transport factor 2 family protein [Streptomyces sp. HNM0575]|uniref:nuclear transport factor 2 family protein n=1 Tax=Streptomyces sp. HNM0575 TaxID=2716338 RepID=UPI00145DE3E3|nr:nuclear transport factor 2 family protein [Streptomyces sp. HNM0575]NLU76457.1 nuclear transport factor 2 family protein [Streptomyces sp. HNM0575]
MDTVVPDVIPRYFEADARRDADAVVALFTDDAAIVDEDRTWRGAGEIREWREGTASQYSYTTQVLGTEAVGDGTFLVTGRIEGDFPGGTADLKWRFTVAGGAISRLEIAP